MSLAVAVLTFVTQSNVGAVQGSRCARHRRQRLALNAIVSGTIYVREDGVAGPARGVLSAAVTPGVAGPWVCLADARRRVGPDCLARAAAAVALGRPAVVSRDAAARCRTDSGRRPGDGRPLHLHPARRPLRARRVDRGRRRGGVAGRPDRGRCRGGCGSRVRRSSCGSGPDLERQRDDVEPRRGGDPGQRPRARQPRGPVGAGRADARTRSGISARRSGSRACPTAPSHRCLARGRATMSPTCTATRRSCWPKRDLGIRRSVTSARRFDCCRTLPRRMRASGRRSRPWVNCRPRSGSRRRRCGLSPAGPSSMPTWRRCSIGRETCPRRSGTWRRRFEREAARGAAAKWHYNLAAMLARTGDAAGARRHLTAALQIDPRDQPARRALELIR